MKKLMMKMTVVFSLVLAIGMLCGCTDDEAAAEPDETASAPVAEVQDDSKEEDKSADAVAEDKTEAKSEAKEESAEAVLPREENAADTATDDSIEVIRPQELVEEIMEEYADESTEPVELTIPAQFIDVEITQESLDSNLAEGVTSAKLNNDGSVTYVMTGEAHTKMVKDEREIVVDSLALMIESGDYPSFRKIEHNSDFTEFIVKIEADELDMAEAVSTLGFFMLGEEYNAYVGEQPENIRVKYVNIDSGKVIEQVDSKDMDGE